MRIRISPASVVAVLTLGSIPALAEQPADDEIAEITVKARRVAIERPAGTYASVATTLRFDPLTELQSRGLAEGQSDVTVRGGLFENTGFQLGAVTVMDPQTGHYVAELPVDPAVMTTPAILKGINNAVRGFNSAIATVSYGYAAIDDGGSITLGAGSDALNFQSLRFSQAWRSASGADFGGTLSMARSEGDGTLSFGDHAFERYNLHLQRRAGTDQSDLIVSYQDKFYGWPGAYTGFATLAETDETQTTLIQANHRRETRSGWLEFGGFYRRLIDDYDFDRTTEESGEPGSFEHETRVLAVGFQGLLSMGKVNWRYGGQLTSDELVRSTDLTNGRFDDRDYARLTVVPSIDLDLRNGRELRMEAGATFDYSNRDDNALSPLIGITLSRQTTSGSIDYGLEYTVATQLPGYTVLNSRPAGLFGGNPALGREEARQFVLSATARMSDWQGRIAVFQREDDDLVDWTFESGAPFARQANAVDLDVIGAEAFLSKQWEQLELAAGYTYIDKDANYGSATVDASFYALNFARHRATLALTWRPVERLELRLDNEYRDQEENPLRAGSESSYRGSFALKWRVPSTRDFEIAAVVDNISDADLQPFPGTPAVGRQYSVSASYNW